MTPLSADSLSRITVSPSSTSAALWSTLSHHQIESACPYARKLYMYISLPACGSSKHFLRSVSAAAQLQQEHKRASSSKGDCDASQLPGTLRFNSVAPLLERTRHRRKHGGSETSRPRGPRVKVQLDGRDRHEAEAEVGEAKRRENHIIKMREYSIALVFTGLLMTRAR
jgi:hypothetical protein